MHLSRLTATLLAASVAAVMAIHADAPARQASLALDRAALAAQVRTEFVHAWTSYKRLAWGHDELNPVSRTPHDWYPPAIVYMTPIDSLDTLQLMGLKADAAEVTMKALNETALAAADAEKMRTLLDALDELDDVQNVYTTAAM